MVFDVPPIWWMALGAIWLFQAWWCAWNTRRFRRKIHRWDRRFARIQPFTPSVVAIVPVKGVDAEFEGHVAAILEQDYPAYRVLFVVESADDPAAAPLQARAAAFPTGRESGCLEIRVEVAGASEHGGQKVHNLRHGLAQLRETDEAIVFADADAVPDDQWLTRMTRELRRPDVAATTGYRWLIPAPGSTASWPTAFASVLNSSVATLYGYDRQNHAWGGSTAILQETARTCELDQAWQGALSDDYQLTRTLRAHGRRVLFIPRCVVASPAAFTWRSLLEFGRRQYVITRTYAPGVWLLALAFMAVYFSGWIGTLVVALGAGNGWGYAVAALALILGLDHWRASNRAASARELFGAVATERLKRARALDRWAMPLCMVVHAGLILSSAVGRRLTWAGITYLIRGRRDVAVLAHPPAPDADNQPAEA